MAKVRDVIEVMENWAPSQLAESWDNVGLITGDPETEVRSVIISLDVTEETITLALKNKASIIVSHHPPIFKPLKNLIGSNLPSRIIRLAVKEDISLYTSHSNLDQVSNGVSQALAEKLGLNNIIPLSPGNCELLKFVTYTPPEYTDKIREAAGYAGAGVIGEYKLCSFTSRGIGTYMPSSEASPYEGESDKLSRVEEDRIEMVVPAPFISNVIEETRKVHPYEEMAYDIIPLSRRKPTFGYGAVGDIRKSMKISLFTEHVSKSLGIETLKVSKGGNKSIKRVAVMGGSGRDYISRAISAGADAYVTGDLGHHDFLNNCSSTILIDASHRATELPVLDKIKERLHGSPSTEKIEIIIDCGNTAHNTYKYVVKNI